MASTTRSVQTRSAHTMFVVFILLLSGSIRAMARSFDFYYFVQQWPGSYCDTRRGCCYPRTGKPAADFSIHGLWPNNEDGTWPSNCDHSEPFDYSQISDLENDLNRYWGSLSCPSSDGHRFWSHEWEKHGTCSFNLHLHDYFQAALSLRHKIDLLDALDSAGIRPDGSEYRVSHIEEAIRERTGETPGMECNGSEEGRPQLYQIYVCVDKSDASTVIPCPIYPRSRCPSRVVFPPFGDDEDNINAELEPADDQQTLLLPQ